jgi:hypothetical protein
MAALSDFASAVNISRHQATSDKEELSMSAGKTVG